MKLTKNNAKTKYKMNLQEKVFEKLQNINP